MRKVGAGIEHFPVQPQLVERVADIVVVMDILLRPRTRVQFRLIAAICVRIGNSAEFGRVSHGLIDGFQERRQPAFDLDPTGTVIIAEVKEGIGHQPQESRPIADYHADSGDSFAWRNFFPIPQCHPQCWFPKGMQKFTHQPAVDTIYFATGICGAVSAGDRDGEGVCPGIFHTSPPVPYGEKYS